MPNFHGNPQGKYQTERITAGNGTFSAISGQSRMTCRRPHSGVGYFFVGMRQLSFMVKEQSYQIRHFRGFLPKTNHK